MFLPTLKPYVIIRIAICGPLPAELATTSLTSKIQRDFRQSLKISRYVCGHFSRNPLLSSFLPRISHHSLLNCSPSSRVWLALPLTSLTSRTTGNFQSLQLLPCCNITPLLSVAPRSVIEDLKVCSCRSQYPPSFQKKFCHSLSKKRCPHPAPPQVIQRHARRAIEDLKVCGHFTLSTFLYPIHLPQVPATHSSLAALIRRCSVYISLSSGAVTPQLPE